MAYIAFDSADSSSISVYIAGLDSSWNRGDRPVAWTVDGYDWGTSYLPNQITEGGYITLTGLSASTTYTIGAVITFPDSADTSTPASIQASTTAPPPPVYVAFDWNSSERNALLNNGATTAITATRFNELISSVAEMLQVYGLADTEVLQGVITSRNLIPHSAPTTLAAVLNACHGYVSSGSAINAQVYNTVRFCIGNKFPTGSGLKTYYTGDMICGWYFLQIVDALNGRL